ncbi:hypothetical protein [Methanosarcina barkeri]|uniref:hypothetical protein n=1 Tax=Methanosarcina barkeri TaxID=2208 RepID=UPI00003C6A78|nr:hypothetical protein [Methanosarcina barkeri]
MIPKYVQNEFFETPSTTGRGEEEIVEKVERIGRVERLKEQLSPIERKRKYDLR